MRPNLMLIVTCLIPAFVMAPSQAHGSESDAMQITAVDPTAIVPETALSAVPAKAPGTAQQPVEPPVVAPAAARRLTLDLGVTWTSAYYFRGYLQEDDGSCR
jgi:hypothetical protein